MSSKQKTQESLFEEIEAIVWLKFGKNISESPTEEEIRAFIQAQLTVNLMLLNTHLADEIDENSFVSRMVDKYKKDQSYRKEVGSFLVDSDGNKPWLDAIKMEVDWHYWNQYCEYLVNDKRWTNSVVESLSVDTEKILDLAGNPNSIEPFKKKGLVVANVQSGKTSNYTGLICRAADVGYKYIIVIASTTNDLRLQTQQRIEEGFIGLDYWNRDDGKPIYVGVGQQYGFKRHPNPGTTRECDFRKAKMRTLLQISADNTNEPWIFVIKKNPSTLRNLIIWLEANVHTGDSLLLIDDEADTASINVKYGKQGISTINGLIRQLLTKFDRSSYIGYTATPFANVLIDPDEVDEEHGSDLFPRNYIYTLSPSSAYFGPLEVFGDVDDNVNPRYLRYIYDINTANFNKRDFAVDRLPESLKNAIDYFLLASTVRVLRNENDCHTTMLVNISAYVDPQRQIQHKITRYLQDEVCPALKVFGSMNPDEAARNSEVISRFKNIWDTELAKTAGIVWAQVFKELFDVSKVTRTALINYKSQDALDYDGRVEHVIAIGGNRLSRGLTLEGLLVSYFSRNSRAYDTLMQMARWFGYRVGYEDLCRVWITEESAGWCAFVTEASEDLMNDFIDMMQKKMTPMQYGHKIKAHPGTLMVTARNKMGAGELRRKQILSGKFVETTVLRRDMESMKNNQIAVQELLNDALSVSEVKESKFGPILTLVPSDIVGRFFGRYANCYDSMATDSDLMQKYVLKYKDEGKDKWDILIACAGKGKENSKNFNFCGKSFACERRVPGVLTDLKKVFVGNRYKVSTREIERAGLSEEQQVLAEQEYNSQPEGVRKKSKDWFYRSYRKYPLLIIHHLFMAFDNLPSDDKRSYESRVSKIDTRTGCYLSSEAWPSKEFSLDMLAWSVSFPSLKNDEGFDYVLTKAALKGMSLGDDEEDEGEERDDDE